MAGTSDEHITILEKLRDHHPDGAVLVTTPQAVALADVRKELNFCRKVELPILGVIENMSGFVCPYCAVFPLTKHIIDDRNVQIYFQQEVVKLWLKNLESPFLVCPPKSDFILTILLITGRAPIDPNFVLAIERNQQNQIQKTGESGENDVNSGVSTIVDEYKKLALFDVFKGIVSKLVNDDGE